MLRCEREDGVETRDAESNVFAGTFWRRRKDIIQVGSGCHSQDRILMNCEARNQSCSLKPNAISIPRVLFLLLCQKQMKSEPSTNGRQQRAPVRLAHLLPSLLHGTTYA